MIPEAQHLNPLPGEELVSLFVPCPLIRKTVSAAIEFDRQFCDGAIEIQKVDPAWVLAAEFEVVEATVTQQTPQAFFGAGGFLAKVARDRIMIGLARRHKDYKPYCFADNKGYGTPEHWRALRERWARRSPPAFA